MPAKHSSPSNPATLREQAEGSLRVSPPDIAGMSTDEIQKLVHELQVHQIELKIQNEELLTAQAELAHSRDRFNDLYDFAPVGYLTTDYEGTVLEANLTAAKMLGVERRNLVGRKFTRFVVPAAQDALYLHQQSVFAGGEKQACELVLRRADGATFSAQMESIGTRDSTTNGHHCRSAIVDISERKAVEEKVAARERRFRALTEKAAENIILLDAGGRILYESPQEKPLLGFAPEEMNGRTGLELVHPDDQSFARQKLKEILRVPGATLQAELRMRRKDGGWSWIHFFATNLLDEPTVGAVVLNLHNITERKEAEERLRDSEARLRLFIESAPTGIAIFDREMRYLAVSRRWAEDHHATGNLLGRSHYEVFPDLPERWKAVHRRSLAGEVVTADEDRFDRADGTTQWMKWEARPWRTDAGEIGGIMIAAEDVTGRKQAKDALLKSERLRQLVTDGAPALISYIDADYRFQNVNKLWAEWFARSEATVVGQPVSEVLGEKVWQVVQPLMARALAGESVTFERELRCSTNGLRCLQVTYAPDRDDAGQVRGFVAHATDITARKQAEMALQKAHGELLESEARFRALFESAPVGIAQGAVATGNFVSANQRYCDIVGFTRDELDRMNFKEFTHPDDLQADLDNMARLLAGEIRQYTMEKRYVRRDGGVVWGSLTVAALWEPGEKPLHYMAVVADITARKQSEQALQLAHDELEQRVAERTAELLTTNWKLTNEVTERKQAEVELRESEARFRQVTEAIDQVFWMTDVDKSQMLYVSPGYERIWGRSCQSLYDSPRVWLETVHPDDRARVLDAMLTKQAPGEYDLEFRILRPDGEERWIHERAFPIRDAAGQIHRIAGIAADITERKRLHDEILTAGERERERLGRDLHDGLSQLLVGARLKTDSLAKKLTEQSPENVHRAEAVASLIARAVEESNNLARGLDPVDAVPEGLMTALTQFADLTDRSFGKDCACHFPQPVLVQDHKAATELFRIAQEATNNAIKHGNPGTIRIRLAEESGQIVLTVTNDGQPFPKRPKTTGMGLKTMAFRADRIGATLQINPGPDGGTIVRCTLANTPELSARSATQPVAKATTR